MREISIWLHSFIPSSSPDWHCLETDLHSAKHFVFSRLLGGNFLFYKASEAKVVNFTDSAVLFKMRWCKGGVRTNRKDD